MAGLAKAWLVACVVAVASGVLPASQQDEKAKPDEAKKPPISLAISGDVSPELAPVAGQFTALFYESYPRLIERFEKPDKPAPRGIRLVFEKGMKVPAYCSGAEIHVSVDWLTQHPEDVALLTHELTHAVQAYPPRGGPSWMTEGIADYARLKYGPKVQPGWSLPARLTEKQSYRNSYRITARFLQWLDEKHPGSVDKLHRLMQEGTFKLEAFQTVTGKTADELWKECVSDLDPGADDSGSEGGGDLFKCPSRRAAPGDGPRLPGAAPGRGGPGCGTGGAGLFALPEDDARPV